MRAIAVGYLQKDPPDLTNWARFIQSQLRVEQHPDVWVNIIVNMPRLLNSDRFEATKIFDDVIRNCPEILSYHHALYVIACTVGRFEPQETVQGWLEMLLTEDSSFSHQAYGELLFIYYFQYQDEWSETRICHHLTSQDNEAVLCGLAHAASHLWSQRRCRKLSKEILDSLISFTDQSVQNIVARFFRTNQNQFELEIGRAHV